MAEPHHDIQSLLAAIARTQPHPSTPSQTPPGPPGQVYPPPPAQSPYQTGPPGPPGPPGYGAPPMGLPAPASSGNLDLSAIRPVNSGTMSFDDPAARAAAGDKGPAPYDRHSTRGFRSRSRSPNRGDYGDNSNAYRDGRRGGHSRDYGRDRSFSPGPRGGPFSPRGNGRERSPLRGGDDSSETIQIESSLVGLIIGRQGENLRRIEADTSCRVQFLPANDGGPFRQCRITGPAQRRAEVKAAINRIIDDSGMGPLNRAQEKPRDPVKGGAAVLRDGEDHMQIMVPDRTVGLIIGRGGETIRDLQERSGCHINIVGESKSVNGLRPVNLIGTREAAARAKDSIMEIVDSDSRGDAPPSRGPPGGGRGEGPRGYPPIGGGPGGGYGGGGRDGGGGGGGGGPDKINDSILVPSDAVGMIIGKGGETIREMQSSTGCKINVAQSSGPHETEREIALIGSHDSIARAKDAILEKVDAVRAKGSNGGGRGRGPPDHDRGGYSRDGPNPPTNQQPPSDSAADPYAQYGGYQNYVALWYQSLMHQQQQGGAAAGAPAPGS